METYHLDNGLRRGARYDSVFYGAFSGKSATFDIRVRFELKKKIDLNKFQKAADKALACYPEFRVRPVIKDGRVVYEENTRPVRLYPDNGTPLYFGTEGDTGTNGYLFAFLYGEKHVTFSLFHGLTDARGMIAYIITVMWNYVCAVFPPVRIVGSKMFTKHGVRIDPAPFYAMGETERYDPLTAFASDAPLVEVVDPAEIYALPAEQFDPEDLSCRIVNLEISNEAFLSRTKELDTSFAPLLAAMTGEAIMTAYDVGDKVVSVSITVDPRKQLGTFSFGNMAYNCPLPMKKEDLLLSQKDLCERLRADMKRQITEDNARANYKVILSQCDAIDSMGDIISVNKLITEQGAAHLSTAATVFLTYPGRIGNNPISRVLLDGVTPGMLAVERGVVVYAHRDSLIVQITQKSDDLTLVNAMERVLAKYGFAPKKQDMGRVTQNVLELEKLKKV